MNARYSNAGAARDPRSGTSMQGAIEMTLSQRRKDAKEGLLVQARPHSEVLGSVTFRRRRTGHLKKAQRE